MSSSLETTGTELAQAALVLAGQVWERFLELVMAPLNNQDMIWIAAPLLAATLFMTLYFGRYKKEELGWNTAFGNTMVFLFVAINLIREMYEQGGSLESLFDNSLYFTLSGGLAGAGLLLMFVTYFHLLPKGLAFFLFSAPPINVAVYVVMSIVYADVVPDFVTVLAGFVFLAAILLLTRAIQWLMRAIGLEYIVPVERLELPRGFVKRVSHTEEKKEPEGDSGGQKAGDI
jgi:hypothetical protein